MFTTEAKVQCATIGPGRVAVYDVPVHWLTKGREHRYTPPDPNKEGNPIEAARRARRQAMDAAGWLFLLSRGRYVTDRGQRRYFRQGFWTLTLPEPAPENVARAALSAWWTWARNVHGLKSYLWTAELTDRGRVHFHAIINTWIPVQDARAAWRRALINAGALPADAPDLPAAACKPERCKGSESGRQYAAKYIGKAFGGKRAEQLGRRLDTELTRTDPGPDQQERIAELRARLTEAMERSRAGVRRWSCSQDCSPAGRRGPTVNAAEDGQLLRIIGAELQRIGGRWSPPNDHGQVCFYALDKVNRHATPTLHRMLSAAAAANPN